MGFGCVWLPDHVANPYRPEQDWFECWTLVGAVAASTEAIRVGTMVSSLTLRNPTQLAHAAITADHVSDGRVELGIGAGGAVLDHTLTGVAEWSAAERAERFERAVATVAERLDGDGALHPPAVRSPRPPLTVAAVGPSALETAARHADAWNTMAMRRGRDAHRAVTHDEAIPLLRERVTSFEGACRQAGRDPASVRRSLLLIDSYRDGPRPPDAFLDEVEQFRDIGFGELILYWPGNEEREPALDQIATQALPVLRSGAP